MLTLIRLVPRRNLHQLRQLHNSVTQLAETSAAAAATPPQPTPPPSGSDKIVSPKIDKIANDITALNLIEVAELSDLLKKRLNLPDAPIMPMGGFAMSQSEAEEEEEPQKQVQSAFSVKLVSFDEKQKIALIKEIKNQLPDTNLVQAKKFIEGVPTIVKADLMKDEADKLKEILVKVGGTVEIV